MLFYRLLLFRMAGMFTFLTLAACSAQTVQPSPGDLLTPAPTDPLATFWLPTSTNNGATAVSVTPGAVGTPSAPGTPGAAGAPFIPATVAPGEDNPIPGAPPASGAPTTPAAPAGFGLSGDIPPVVLQAQQWLAGQLKTVNTNVVIQNVERVQWPDACLGLGQPGQGCAQVVTPGYRILFYANGQTYEVRVDETGRVFRLLEGGKG